MSQKEFDIYNEAELKHWWFRGRRKILSTFMEFIETEKEKLLEIGCGTGGNLKYLFQDFKELAGVDQNQQALQYAREKLGHHATILEGDANNLQLEENRYDCIATLDVLCHEAIPDVEKVLQDIYTGLKPGGYFLFSDQAFNFLQGAHTRSVGTARRFTAPKMIATLEKNNFEIVKISYWGFLLFFLLYIKRGVIEKCFPPKEAEEQFDVVRVPVVDEILYGLIYCESLILKVTNIPFGASLAILARKPVTHK